MIRHLIKHTANGRVRLTRSRAFHLRGWHRQRRRARGDGGGFRHLRFSRGRFLRAWTSRFSKPCSRRGAATPRRRARAPARARAPRQGARSAGHGVLRPLLRGWWCAQQLTELEEVLEYAELDASSRRANVSGGDDADGARLAGRRRDRQRGRRAVRARAPGGDTRRVARAHLGRAEESRGVAGAPRRAIAGAPGARGNRDVAQVRVFEPQSRKSAAGAQDFVKTAGLRSEPVRAWVARVRSGLGPARRDAGVRQAPVVAREQAGRVRAFTIARRRAQVRFKVTDAPLERLRFFFSRGFFFFFKYVVLSASFATNARDPHSDPRDARLGSEPFFFFRARMMISPKIDGAAEPDTRVAARSLRAFMS